MAALTANTNRTLRGVTLMDPQIVDAGEIYRGAYMALGSRDHGTSATRGRAFAFNDEAGAIPLGWTLARTTGSTSATPITRGQVDLRGRVVKSIAVSNLAGTIADVGRVVHATSDNDFDITRPTLGHPIGIIVDFESSTLCDVFFFGLETICAIGMAGLAQSLVNLGSIDCDTITAADIRTGIPMVNHGRINSVFAMVDVAITGSSGTALVNLEIAATNVTGGVVTVSTAAGGTKGTLLAGTAVTAANVYKEGDALDIEAATVTDMTAGRVDLFMEVSHEPGI